MRDLPPFWQYLLIASGSVHLSLQTIVSIEFLCHCGVGCALRFFYFQKGGKIFLIQFCQGGTATLFAKLWSVRWLPAAAGQVVRLGNVCGCWAGYSFFFLF